LPQLAVGIKLRVSITLCILVSLTPFVSGQNEASVWCFGYGVGLDFKKAPPDTFRAAKYFFTLEGSASISDTSGNLLFYTNGDSVWNKNHVAMKNGYDMGISNNPVTASASQGALIVPLPNSNSLYYVFTTDDAEHRLKNGYRYSIVDMSLNNGLGDVTTKAQLLVDTVLEKQTAILHSNCTDIWVITHEYNSDAFYAFQLTENGLTSPPVISHVGQIQTGIDKIPSTGTINYQPESMARGYMQSSPDGKKIVVLPFSDYHRYPGPVEVFSFDNATGEISLDYTVEDVDSVVYYGASFSSNSEVLYLTAGWHGLFLHQFDMRSENSKDFLASRNVIHELPMGSNPSVFGGLSLATDGKIYISSHKRWMDVIHQPNILGSGCGYEHQYINLPSFSAHSVPNFMQSYFLPKDEDPCLIDDVDTNNQNPGGVKRIFIPNAFSPNGDEINDDFGIFGVETSITHMKIYNMWGEKIFDRTGMNPRWDGSYLGLPCPSSVYIYFIDYVDYTGKNHETHGSVILLD